MLGSFLSVGRSPYSLLLYALLLQQKQAVLQYSLL
jgi:hypothetical protein